MEKKKEIGRIFLQQIKSLGMDAPSNFDEIVDFIYDDVCETADKDEWHCGDVMIGFRRWIESREGDEGGERDAIRSLSHYVSEDAEEAYRKLMDVDDDSIAADEVVLMWDVLADRFTVYELLDLIGV